MHSDPIKVLIADDHQLVLDGLQSLLSSEEKIKVVATVNDGTEVLSVLEEGHVDVVLLDINMPKMDGIETCLHLNNRYPQIKVLALSTYDEGEMITRMIKNGASGYVLKNITSKELTGAIFEIMKGNRVLDAKLTDRMINSLQNKSTESGIPKLTRREKEILQLIAEELTTQEIADKLVLSVNTILSHRKNLFSKFGVTSSVGMIRKAFEYKMLNDQV